MCLVGLEANAQIFHEEKIREMSANSIFFVVKQRTPTIQYFSCFVVLGRNERLQISNSCTLRNVL